VAQVQAEITNPQVMELQTLALAAGEECQTVPLAEKVQQE
jgi:hypothetical protein